MIINNNIQAITGAYQVAGSAKTTGSYGRAQETQCDEAVLSATGQSFNAMMKELSKTDDVRADKVAALQAEVDSGSYIRDAKDVAASMLGFLF